MKILMMGSVYPRSHDDSEVPWMRETVKRLVEQGLDVEVLAPSWKGLSSHKIDSVLVHRFRYAPSSWEFLTHDEGAPSKLARNPFFQLLAIPYMIIGSLVCLWLCLTRKYDLLHVHWPFPHGLMVIPSQILTRTPVVLNFHGASLLLQRKFKFVKPCLKLVLWMSQGVLTNSSFTRAKVHEISDVEVSLSPYGSPLADRAPDHFAPAGLVSPHAISAPAVSAPYHPAPEHAAENHIAASASKPSPFFQPSEFYNSNNPFKILFVGRHIERKGIEYLIQAFQLLALKRPEFMQQMRLDIVGGGESTEKLQALASTTPELPIEFPGKVSTEELNRYYQEANLFVLPAIVDSKGDTEGLGVVLVEAIETNTPILASNVGGIVDVIQDHQTGLLVEEKSPKAIADAIVEIFEDPSLAQKLVQNAHIHASEFFNWDSITQNLIQYYQARLK